MLKNIVRYLLIITSLCLIFCFTNQSRMKSIKHYDQSEVNYSLNENAHYVESLKYARDYTIVNREDDTNSELFRGCYYALMIDDTDQTVIAASKAHERMYPASMTKLMTAIVVAEKIESGEFSLNDEVTVSSYYDLTSEGVEACYIGYGSKITLKNLLYTLMIQSNNYYALIIADYISGSEEAFVELMNQKALELGATNTHYMNPHGLDHEDHYSTAYDTYLIIKEANKHSIIRDIEKYSEYTYTYINPNGYEVENTVSATNYFLRGLVELPAGYTIETWKTGTTDMAGNCLAMYLSYKGKNYVAIASNPGSKQSLYDAMIQMLCMVK